MTDEKSELQDENTELEHTQVTNNSLESHAEKNQKAMPPKESQEKAKIDHRLHKHSMTSEKIENWIKEGRGKGIGESYKPWLTIRDLSSRGYSIRIKGNKTKRIHHLFSRLEATHFYPADLNTLMKDIWEQYPLLPLEETLAIAKNLGIKHPVDPISKEFIVLTTDQVYVLNNDVLIPRTFKLVKDLNDYRVLEKFEIERWFWKSKFKDWGISTEVDIDPIFSSNCEKMHPYYFLNGRGVELRDVIDISKSLTNSVLSKKKALRFLARDCDEQLGLKPGSCLAVAYHFITRHFWKVDWLKQIDSVQIIEITGVTENFDFNNSFDNENPESVIGDRLEE
jgi:hypothetical protein